MRAFDKNSSVIQLQSRIGRYLIFGKHRPTFGDLSLSCKVSICFSDSLAQRLQLRVFRFGSEEDRNVRVGVFPEREEILIGDAGFGGVALQGVGAGDAQMDQCSDRFVDDKAAIQAGRQKIDTAFEQFPSGRQHLDERRYSCQRFASPGGRIICRQVI